MLDIVDRPPTWSPVEKLGLSGKREAQRQRAKLPANTVVVSADSHLTLTEDLFLPRFPEKFKDKAPRVYYDERIELFQISVNGKPLISEEFAPAVKCVEDLPGCASMSARMKDLDAEGIEKEIVFPQIMPFFNNVPDYQLRELTLRAYNEYIADLQAQYPERFYPVAMPNFWDLEQGPKSIEEIARLGLKTFMLPLHPSKRADGSGVYYQDKEFDPMWAAIQDADIPVCFHIGERITFEGTNGYAPSVMENLGPSLLRFVFAQLVFGGVFDRFPKLKVAFVEGGISWVPGALQDAEMIFDTHAHICSFRPKLRPTEYWRKNCYASFMWDPSGLRQLDTIGVDRVMWSVDYPHNESTFGYSQTAVQAVVDAAPSTKDAQQILGRTAIDLFHL